MSADQTVKLLKDLRVTDLKSELEKRGLATSGVKAVLAERLQKHLEDEEGNDPETFDFNNATTTEFVMSSEEATKEEQEPKDEENESKVEEAAAKEEKGAEEEQQQNNDNNPAEDDSINIMLGEDEDNLFDEDKKEKEDTASSLMDTLPKTASPPRPETAPVVQPFTSKDTISMASRSNKAPSENSSMRVAVDESESVGTQESLEGKDDKAAQQQAQQKQQNSGTICLARSASSIMSLRNFRTICFE